MSAAMWLVRNLLVMNLDLVFSVTFLCMQVVLYIGKMVLKNVFSLSTAESEIRAVYGLRECIKHLLYMKNVFRSLSLSNAVDNPTIAMANLPIEDNAAAIRFGINPSSQFTMKYFD